MTKKAERAVGLELRRLLIRIREDVGSFREMGRETELGEDLFSRVAGGRSGMSTDSIRTLVAVYGARYGFTEDEVLAWAGHRSQDRVTTPPNPDIPSLVRELTPDLQMADAQLDPGAVATIRNILHEQIGMLIRLAKTGKLPPSDYVPEHRGG